MDRQGIARPSRCACKLLMPVRTRTGTALLLTVMALLSLSQGWGIAPSFVSADNSITIQALRTATSTESQSASAQAVVNLETGQIRVELHQATALSVYTVLFVSGSLNPQIGILVTDGGGQGALQATLGSGAYVGMLEISRLGTIQFASASTSFTIGGFATASLTTTTTSSSNTQSNTVTVSNTGAVVFQVEPASRSINAGDLTKFSIRITQSSSVNIFLVARDVPSGSVAIFTPNVGIAAPEFHSTLTIVTSVSTPAGNYAVTIAALINGQEFSTQVALQVSPATATQSNTTTSIGAGLSLIVTTDASQYPPNSTVIVQGHVTDMGGNAVANATVTIQVDSATGAEVFFTNNVQTDAAGTFQSQFNLRGYVALGTYSVFASAANAHYSNTASRTTFVVGSSTTPSVVINSVYAGDSSGNPLSTFSVGQTVWIWVVVQNIGATFQGVIWVQVKDPNGVPVEILIHITNLHSGETVKDGINFTLLGSTTLGVYHVDALVSDKLISQGGTFLANAQTQFVITG